MGNLFTVYYVLKLKYELLKFIEILGKQYSLLIFNVYR